MPQLAIKCVNNVQDAKAQLKIISNRTISAAQHEAEKTVKEILEQVLNRGDEALIQLTEKFDGIKPKNLLLQTDKLKDAWDKTPKSLQDALQLAHQRIKKFHEYQKPKDLSIEGEHGENLGRRWRPVKRAGIYVPGGRASYPSTVLMNAIPAKVAGVQEIVMVSPVGPSGEINRTVLAAAYLAGLSEVIPIGGAQAIGALAFGTETINKVNVISGPGNIYVTLAKKAVYGKVGIDSLAGPSEVLIIADKTSETKQVAADMLAQAEHDPLASAILLTTDSNLSECIVKELEKQIKGHPRERICRKSLSDWGLVVKCENLDVCAELSDEFAPEHLELLIEHPQPLLETINNAGAIFIGPWSPEAMGDYLAGPNHTLPTSGTATFSSALSVETFMKNTSLVEFNQHAFKKTANAVIELAKSEGLFSHSESIRIRLENK